jgi:hypothetical protein
MAESEKLQNLKNARATLKACMEKIDNTIAAEEEAAAKSARRSAVEIAEKSTSDLRQLVGKIAEEEGQEYTCLAHLFLIYFTHGTRTYEPSRSNRLLLESRQLH